MNRMSPRERGRRRRDRENKLIRGVAGWIVHIFLVAMITSLILIYVGQRTRVEGSSMETTLHNGDSLFVDKLSYRLKEPDRFDIVVFPYKYEQGVYYIKRIIGMPGETVQIRDGAVYINGNKLEEQYGSEPMQDAGIVATPMTLGEDEYFLLGDNRNHSKDSRNEMVGPVKRKDLMGKAFVRIWPLDSIGLIRHE